MAIQKIDENAAGSKGIGKAPFAIFRLEDGFHTVPTEVKTKACGVMTLIRILMKRDESVTKSVLISGKRYIYSWTN